VVEQSKVVTEGTVNATAVESMTGDSAVVLVQATSKVTNSAGANQEPRSWRFSITVTRDGGQLKMSKVEFIP
jgi:Mce-associated membrane protein